MAQNNEVTLIIQGPLTIYTTFMLYRYADKYPIILVIPKDTSEVETVFKEINRILQNKEYNISLFMYDTSRDESILNTQNRYYHFLSTQLGLIACKTPYTIKVRSDEFYSNLDPFVETVLNSSGKVVTNDVFFRNSKLPYHPCDHLIGGETIDLLKTFELARKFSEDKDYREAHPLVKFCKSLKTPMGENLFFAEQQLGVAAISTYYTQPKLEKSSVSDIMKDRFVIVPSSELGMFKVTFNSNKKGPTEYFDDSYYNKDIDVRDIQAYE